ncbi:hypothetical protein [Gymnodinialimonas ulvae]|uniref:hypothetical protein n=1 Tax=Gymnodinialimonas ulvae TaxID=3126504 RepID=UPI0030A25458
MSETTWWIVIGVCGLIAVFLAIQLAGYVVIGALALFAWASRQGASGLVIYFALWVLLMPLMLVFSAVTGFFENKQINETHKKTLRTRENEANRYTRKPIRSQPPADPKERYKWANRLPPYD